MDLDGPQGAEVFDVDPDVEVGVSGLAITSESLGIDNAGTLTLSDCELGNDGNALQVTTIENDGSLTVDNCNMSGNGTPPEGYSTGLINNGTATLTDVQVEGYDIDHGSNGGPTAIDNSGEITINSSQVVGNTSYFGGGTIENNGGSVTIVGSTVSDNGFDTVGLNGIINASGTMNISNSTVSDNNFVGIENSDTLSVSDSTIDSNPGGGIIGGGTLTVTDSTLSRNVGGAINSDGGPATVTGSTISNNVVKGKAHGGGISNAGTMNIESTTVSGNNSNDEPGGGIYNDGSMSLTDSNVSSNTNSAGGGGVDNVGSLIVSDSTIAKNTLVDTGGAGGGGILNESPNKGPQASLVLTASTLAENHSNSHGGGIENDGGSALVTASTLTQNASDKQGGGIDNVGGGSATLAATVLAGASPDDCSGVMTDAGYNLDDDGSCDFSGANLSYSDVAPYLGPLQNNGGPTKTEEPALGSPVLDDIPMGATANGVTLCPSTDQRGIARPQGSECDIGAVELSPTPQDITSADDATATADLPFSFTVTTTGSPVPKLSETGSLPKKLTFTDNGNGTATISGKSKNVGSSELLLKAKYGGYVVLQVFTLTTTAG